MSMNYATERPEIPFEAISHLEKELSLPVGFYDDIFDKDDRSFVTELYTFIDKAVSLLLIEAFGGEGQLHSAVSKLDLIDKNTGKMAFLKALNSLEQDYQDFIFKLSEVKDYLEQSLDDVEIDLYDYINQSKFVDNPKNFDSLTQIICCRIPKVEFDDRKLSNVEYMRENPKIVIWYVGLSCLAVIYIKKANIIEIRKLQKVKERKLGQLEGAELVLEKLGISFNKPELKKGIEAVDHFSDLICLPGVDEPVITQFLAKPDNQFILKIAFLARCIFPEKICKWPSNQRKPIKPDFFVEGSNGYSDIVEFKLPTYSGNPIVGIENRKTFSARINSYVSQTRTYREYFEDPRNRKYVLKKHGITVMYPTRYLVIGKRAMFSTNEWKAIENDSQDLRIKTYDDILDSVSGIIDIVKSAI